MQTEKVCTRCGESQSLEEFYRRGKNGARRAICWTCCAGDRRDQLDRDRKENRPAGSGECVIHPFDCWTRPCLRLHFFADGEQVFVTCGAGVWLNEIRLTGKDSFLRIQSARGGFGAVPMRGRPRTACNVKREACEVDDDPAGKV